MTSKPLTPQIGRKLLAQLEEPKRESAIVLDGSIRSTHGTVDESRAFWRSLNRADLLRGILLLKADGRLARGGRRRWGWRQ
jgi:hypothetical protein